MATLLQFKKDSDILVFEAGADYPAARPIEIFQVKDRTAAGSLQIETLGVTVRKRILSFNLMTLNDYNALIDWFINIVNGGKETFEFTDEKGIVGDAKITSNIIDFLEVDFELFSGSIELEYV